MKWREGAKKRASLEAVKHVKDGYVVGLGSGTTVAYALQEIGRRVHEEGLRILGIPTSYQAMNLALDLAIPLTTLDEHPQPDLAIDGADQVDERLNLIKGRGGALTREKIVDSSAKRLIIIVDETKLTKVLGLGQTVPVEVLPFGLKTVLRRLEEMNGKPFLRMSVKKDGPLITDNGNFIVDVDFGPIEDPIKLENQLKSIPGVIETGLFIQLTDLTYVGYKSGKVRKLEKKTY